MGFKGFAILEIMGHRQVAGMVQEVTLFGVPMAQVDIPEVPAIPKRIDPDGWGVREIPGIPAHTQYYGGQSVFCMSPCTEEIAREAAVRFRASPPQPLSMPSSRQIEAALDADLVEEGEPQAPDVEELVTQQIAKDVALAEEFLSKGSEPSR
jgi:hypothetical protein